MLIIGRKSGERIIIDDDIEIKILEIGRNRVKFGITAPEDIPINTKVSKGKPEPPREHKKK